MTDKQQLLQVRLGADLESYVRISRADGQSWKVIAKRLQRQTGVRVTFEALRHWYPDGVYVNRTYVGDIA